MERIILEVDETVGKIYRGFSETSKRQFNQAVSILLKKAANAEYSKLLDDNSNEAIRNGLTPEILNGLLAADD
jgi:hypothetical protein